MTKDNAKDLFDHYIKILVIALNDIHKCSFTDYEWRGLLGPWLHYVINNSLTLYRNQELLPNHLESKQSILNPGYNTSDTLDIINSEKYLSEFSLLLDLCNKNKVKEFFFPQEKISLHKANNLSLIKFFFYKFFNFFFSKKSNDLVVFSDVQMSPIDILKLGFKIKKSSFYMNDLDFLLQPELSINFEKRKELQKRINSEEGLNFFISWVISLTIPVIYFEDFDRQRNNFLNKVKIISANCRVIISSTGWYLNESLKFFSFLSKHPEAKILAHQHGGNYGVHENLFFEEFEREISDIYVSWGWEDKNVSVLPSPKLSHLSKYKKYKRNKNKKILYVATTYPKIPTDDRYEIGCLDRYIDNMRSFLASLNDQSLVNFILRPYRDQSSQIIYEVWQEFNPEIQIEFWSTPLIKSIKSSMLCVCDNLQTTFLESLVSNTPTILYLNKNMRAAKYKKDHSEFFNLLSKTNIFHPDPVSAARFINKISESKNAIDEWWFSDEVQTARDKYCNKFALTSDTYIIDWAEQIDQL